MNKLLYIIPYILINSSFSTEGSIDEINTNQSVVNNIINDTSEYAKYYNKHKINLENFINEAVEKLTDQIVEEAKQGKIEDGGFLDHNKLKEYNKKNKKHLLNTNASVSNIKKILKSLFNGENINFSGFDSPSVQNGFILYKYLSSFFFRVLTPK